VVASAAQVIATLSPARRLRGTFTLPGDKSLSHRLALFGGMAHGPTRLTGFSSAADCQSTLDCLRAMGVSVQREGATVAIDGSGLDGWRAPAEVLDAGNSGTTIRMLMGALAGRPFRAVVSGDASLNRRPMERVAVPLRAMGARIATHDGRPPVEIEGGGLRGMEHTLPMASAQVKTALLLAGLQASGRTRVTEPAKSRDHTERLLPLFGVDVVSEGLSVSVQGGARLRGTTLQVPGDPSSAAFLVVAALIVPGSALRLEGVLLNRTRTAFLDVLRAMGGHIESGLTASEHEPVGWIEARASRLVGVAVDPAQVPALIDEVPALAVAGACASGEFSVSGAAELRVKESDRVAALAEGLSRMGADVAERPDGLVVRGGRPLQGAQVRAHEDHRIAMALSVASLVAAGTTELEGSECVAVSYPRFFDDLREAQK
jgi:3-phosphoshikimate 1-carboxyvinyltransferase